MLREGTIHSIRPHFKTLEVGRSQNRCVLWDSLDISDFKSQKKLHEKQNNCVLWAQSSLTQRKLVNENSRVGGRKYRESVGWWKEKTLTPPCHIVSYDFQSRTGKGVRKVGVWGWEGRVDLSKSESSQAQSGLYWPDLNVPCRCPMGRLCSVCF